jgi:hypothetical protein
MCYLIVTKKIGFLTITNMLHAYFFVLKNSKIIIDVHGIQGMRCVMCHGSGGIQILRALTTQGTKKVLLPTTQSMALRK